MKDYIIIEAFSNETIVSKRIVSFEDYYDGECIEIDDPNFVRNNKITMIKISVLVMNKIDYNFYNADFKPYKFVTIENNQITQVELCCNDEIFDFLNVTFFVEKKICVVIDYKKKISQNIKIFGGIANDTLSDIFFEKILSEATDKCTFYLDKVISKKDHFFIKITSDTNNKIIQ